MFKCSSLRNFLPQLWTSLRVASYHNPALTYGNSSMPDKLYKTIQLEMKSAEPAVLKSYESFITQAAAELEIPVGKIWGTKPSKKRWSVLKSVFIYRKHLVQYEVRTYYRWIELHKMTGSTADTFLEYIERMLPEGVGLKVTRCSIEPLPSHITEAEIKKALNNGGVETPVSENESQSEEVESEGEQQQQQQEQQKQQKDFQ